MGDDGTVVRVPCGYRVGAWRVTRALASGSWSSVYAAERHPSALPSDVPPAAALKFIPTGTLTNRQLAFLAQMTEREVSVGQRVFHPHLVRLYETHVIDDPADPRLDGASVLVMELAERSAAALVNTLDGGVPDAARIIIEVCAGLAHLHAAGWVHGDLKPGNVLLMADGSVRLADFGLAAEIDGTHAYLPPGGTADYVPPERADEDLGHKGVAVRQTADVWALGVTACQLLTGRLPFSGVTSRARSAAATAYAAGTGRLTLPAGLPPEWHDFVADCLAADHAERMRHSADDLLRRAQAIATPGTARPAPRRWRRAMVAAVALSGIAGIGGTLGALQHWRTPAAKATSTTEGYFDAAEVPAKYQAMIVEAGTSCPGEPTVTPLLIAAMLKTESNFNQNLADPGKDEYGIARWTPSVLDSVLQYLTPAGQQTSDPLPQFSAEVSIRAMGNYLCYMAPQLQTTPGDRTILLAAAYRTSVEKVQAAHGVPATVSRDYLTRLRANLVALAPVSR
jgi:serine/threonine protein kinase